MSFLDRSQTVETFRNRLEQLIRESGLSRSAFAGEAGLDRSTLSQILSPSNNRLPRLETVVAMAGRHEVSVDWLLGLSQERAGSQPVTQFSLEVERGAPPSDQRLARWHQEATGYKIRYVPATLPDLLKTDQTLAFEYRDSQVTGTEKEVRATHDRLNYQRKPETDTEICSSLQSVEELARGEGIWKAMPYEARREQLHHLRNLTGELYPRLRWFFFDGRRHLCVPLTVFGPLRAVIYVGDMYFVFNTREHIRVLTSRFDDLIRASVIQPHEVTGFLSRQLERMER